MPRMLCLLVTIAAVLPSTALAQEATDEPGLLKRAAKVDKPIADTYEPLNSTYVGDGERLNESIEQSWQLKKRAKEQETLEAAGHSAERDALEQRIQEPGAATPGWREEPVVESTEAGLSIKDPR